MSRIIKGQLRSFHEACVPLSALRRRCRGRRNVAPVCLGRGRASCDADVQQRRAACAAEAVSGMPPAELDRADVVHDLQGYAPLCARHRKSRRRQDDAAMVCRPDRGAFQEHQAADRRRDRADQRLGEERRARRGREGQARARAVRRRLDDREARHHRRSSRRTFSCRRPASSISPTSSCARTSRRTCG